MGPEHRSRPARSQGYLTKASGRTSSGHDRQAAVRERSSREHGAHRAAGLPGRARPGRRRRRLVGDVPVGDEGLPGPAGRRQRRGVAGDDRPPQGHRRHPRGRPPRHPGRRDPGHRPATARRGSVPPPASTTTWPTPSPRCRRSRNRPSPTTTWPGCPTPMSPHILGGSADAARRAAADGIATLAAHLPGRRRNERRALMNTDDLTRDLVAGLPRHRRPPAPAARPAGRAPRTGTASSTSPTGRSTAPVGPLLLAATDAGPGPGRLRPRGPRRRPAGPGRPDQPPYPARPRPPGRGRPGTRGVLRRATAQLRPAAGLAAVRRVPARGAEPPARDRLRAAPPATPQSPSWPATPRRSAPSARPARPTRCRSSCPATGSSAPTAAWAATVGGPDAKRTLLTLEAAA